MALVSGCAHAPSLGGSYEKHWHNDLANGKLVTYDSNGLPTAPINGSESREKHFNWELDPIKWFGFGSGGGGIIDNEVVVIPQAYQAEVGYSGGPVYGYPAPTYSGQPYGTGDGGQPYGYGQSAGQSYGPSIELQYDYGNRYWDGCEWLGWNGSWLYWTGARWERPSPIIMGRWYEYQHVHPDWHAHPFNGGGHGGPAQGSRGQGAGNGGQRGGGQPYGYSQPNNGGGRQGNPPPNNGGGQRGGQSSLGNGGGQRGGGNPPPNNGGNPHSPPGNGGNGQHR